MLAGKRRGDIGKAGMAGEAVDQRHAIEHHARGQGAEHEIFQAGFRRAQIVAVDGGDDIECQRLQFQRQIGGDQVVGRDHQQHADSGQHQQYREFELVQMLRTRLTHAHDHRGHRADQRHDLEEAGKAIGDEGAAESQPFRTGHQDPRAGDEQQQDGEARDRACGFRAGEHPDHQQRQRADGEDQLRRREMQTCKQEFRSHVSKIPVHLSVSATSCAACKAAV